MATNYTIGQAVEIIRDGKDVDAVTEIGRRFPLMTVKIAEALANGGQAVVDLFNAMPDYVTALKVSNGVKAQFGSNDPEEAEGDEEEKPKKKAAAKKAAPKKAAKKPVKKAEVVEEDEDEEDEAAGKYDGMKPKALYDECKKRGLDVDPRKAAKVYVDALLADDAGDGDDDEDEDDWDI